MPAGGASARRPLPDAPPGFRWRRLWPLALLLAGLALVWLLELDRFLSFEALRQHRVALTDWVAQHQALAIPAFLAIYTAVVAFSLPGGALMTMVGGFLFGPWLGTLLAVSAASLGAALVFLAARTALGDVLRARAGPALRKMEAGFRRNAFNYLLVLRLIPLFPFFVVNLVPAFLGVPFRTYLAATVIGIVPGTFVYAEVGAGLGSIFDRGESFSVESVLTPEIITALVGLAVLALLPVAYRHYKAKRRTPPESG